MNRRACAFTLVELCVVVLLLATATTVTTVALRSVSDSGRLRSASDRIGAQLQAARLFSAATRLPVSLQCEPRGCLVWKPSMAGGEWTWIHGGRFELPDSVAIVGVAGEGVARDSSATDRWNIPIRPDAWSSECTFDLALRGALRLVIRMHGPGRRAELRWIEPGSSADDPHPRRSRDRTTGPGAP